MNKKIVMTKNKAMIERKRLFFRSIALEQKVDLTWVNIKFDVLFEMSKCLVTLKYSVLNNIFKCLFFFKEDFVIILIYFD